MCQNWHLLKFLHFWLVNQQFKTKSLRIKAEIGHCGFRFCLIKNPRPLLLLQLLILPTWPYFWDLLGTFKRVKFIILQKLPKTAKFSLFNENLAEMGYLFLELYIIDYMCFKMARKWGPVGKIESWKSKSGLIFLIWQTIWPL